MKRILIGIALLVGLLLVIIITKTLLHPFVKLNDSPQPPVKKEVSEQSLQRFAKGLQYATVSHIDSIENDFAVYDSFLVYLSQSYPRVFAAMEDTLLNKYQLVLKWKGKNASLPPLLFVSHYDVVAPGDTEHVDEDLGQNMFDLSDSGSVTHNESVAEFRNWQYAPFAGKVSNRQIYGRGAIDMKSVVFSLLETCDALLAKGFIPERDMYFAFDPDEEVGGLRGARIMAAYFKQQGITFEAIYDEGGIVAAPGTAEGINQPIAFVGMGEKGVVGYRIRVQGTGGHSSMPPLKTAAGNAAIIMQRLEKNQFNQQLIKPTQDFLNIAGSGMGFMGKMAIANQWLFQSLLFKQLEKNPQANALTRTTTAITQLKGSDGNNVLAPFVDVVVNFRILPGETSKDVLEHIQKASEGFDVQIDAVRVPVEPSRLSPANGRPYELIEKAIGELYPGTLVTPYLTIGATDSKHLGELSERIYRFMPALLQPIEQRSIHNYNEYISIENYGRMIAYYTFLMQHYDDKSM
jgi:carboxypeptidase PM20D1